MKRNVRQTMINTIKSIKDIELLKEMLIEYIEKDQEFGPIK